MHQGGDAGDAFRSSTATQKSQQLHIVSSRNLKRASLTILCHTPDPRVYCFINPSVRMRERAIVVVMFVCLSVCVQQISKVAALQQWKQART